MRESAIEASCVRHAMGRGCLSFKLHAGAVGAPDRIFLLPGRRCWVVEFKTATGQLSPRQKVVHASMECFGHPVDVVRSTKQFRELLDALLRDAVD